MALDDPEQPMTKPPTVLGNIFSSLPPSGSTAWITTFFSKQEREVGCFLRLRDEPTGRELYQSSFKGKDNIYADLPFPVKWGEAVYA